MVRPGAHEWPGASRLERDLACIEIVAGSERAETMISTRTPSPSPHSFVQVA